MTDLTFRSDMTVTLVDHMGSDASVVRAARVSTKGASQTALRCPECCGDGLEGCPACHGSNLPADAQGLVRYLLANRHGSPFEHNAMTFYIEAPIFVWREFMRHRIGFSYNEESGRYRELEPVFYVPADDRPLVQVGKAGAYEFHFGYDPFGLLAGTAACMNDAASVAFSAYRDMLDGGIAREVARMCLPVNIYSRAYVTCNARSLMSFLSLRTKREDSTFPSYPQREIELVAEGMEAHFARLFPITYEAFNAAGRVAP